mmetsp:Transcript_16991/g.36929  ORF Transcript_16991/g.36929 Transcript_16991/m.36929 type:complete len:324 (+) Transcript_16991:2-973(+)
MKLRAFVDTAVFARGGGILRRPCGVVCSRTPRFIQRRNTFVVCDAGQTGSKARADVDGDADSRYSRVREVQALYEIDSEHVSDEQEEEEARPSFSKPPSPYTKRWLVARRSAERLGTESKTQMTYGELDLNLFAAALAAAQPKTGDVFLDVGSGAGKLVLCAARLHAQEFAECRGVEILSELQSLSEAYYEEFKAQLRRETCVRDSFDSGETQLAPCVFEHGDFENADFNKVDVVCVYATTYESTGPYLTTVARVLTDQLRFGARVIVVDKMLAERTGPNVGFDLTHTVDGPNADTGSSTAYVYEKVERRNDEGVLETMTSMI